MAAPKCHPRLLGGRRRRRYAPPPLQERCAASRASAAARPCHVARAVLRMLGLDLAVMAVLITLATIVVAVGIELPATALENMDISWLVVALVVIAAPLLEEIAFRGWLSGRPAHVFGLLAIVSALGTGQGEWRELRSARMPAAHPAASSRPLRCFRWPRPAR